MKNVVMGTAGHIDHGKTALVKRLTGIDTDRLEEEKRRGMTIELGFAPLTLPSGSIISIIDVPGHEYRAFYNKADKMYPASVNEEYCSFTICLTVFCICEVLQYLRTAAQD